MGLESSIRTRELGRRLLLAAQRAGLRGCELADRLHWSQTKLSRTFSGQRVATEPDVAAILGLCDAIGPEGDQALRLSEPYQDAALHLPNDDLWPVYLVHARETERVVEFQPFIVPWMIQTPEYTRALIADSPLPHADTEAHVRARREATGLTRLPSVDLFVHEWSLRTPLPGASLMSDQLHHMLRVSVRPSVSVRVVPVGHAVHAGLHGGFSLLEFAECGPVLYREGHVAGVMLDHDPAIDACLSIVDHLDRIALDDERSREMIGNIAIELYDENPI